MTIDKKVVLVSDKGLNKRQLFVESKPVVAGHIRSYINSFREIRDAVKETYPSAKFYFKEIDELEKPILENVGFSKCRPMENRSTEIEFPNSHYWLCVCHCPRPFMIR